jgi:pilus assembly protein CpaB
MRTKLALLAAVVLGFIAAIGARAFLQGQQRKYEDSAKRVRVATASEDITPGALIQRDMVKPHEIDSKAFSAMYHILYDSEMDSWIGRRVTRKIPADEPIMKTDFLSQEAPTEAERKIDPGWRAVTVAADQISGVAGLISPGKRVDIYFTYRSQGAGPEAAAPTVTKALVINVEVLATDNRTQESFALRPGARGTQLDRGYSSVTLLVTPLEAELLTFAQTYGKVSFALRNKQDAGPDKPLPDVSIRGFEEYINAAARERIEKTKAKESKSPIR